MDGFRGQDLACIRSERIVFEGLDFAVAPGAALVLTGANGSGKTSLLRIMAGIARPAAGALLWQGRPVGDDPEAFFGDIHYLGHRDAIKAALTLRENLAFHAALRTTTGSVDAALDRFGLAALADMPARLLSAGQTRRLALARLLASSAPLWLLDEPTIALDRASVEAVMDAIIAHRASGGIVIASTNVPLGMDGAVALDVSAFSPVQGALWGVEESGSGSAGSEPR